VSGVASPTPRPRDRRGGLPDCALARTDDELARHFAIRHAVFVVEQALFAADDRDALDDAPQVLHAIGRSAGRIAGAVRLYPLDADGLWKGDRLAVLPAFRRGLLGAALVRFAVRTAGDRGGRRMVAMIQLGNAAFFESLGWRPAGPVVRYHGADHQPMEIALGAALRRPARSAARGRDPRPSP
jgi:putative N-acetyltransferase (TIGR04045 family)